MNKGSCNDLESLQLPFSMWECATRTNSNSNRGGVSKRTRTNSCSNRGGVSKRQELIAVPIAVGLGFIGIKHSGINPRTKTTAIAFPLAISSLSLLWVVK